MKRYLLAILLVLAPVHDPSHADVAIRAPRVPTGLWSVFEVDSGRLQCGVTHVDPQTAVDVLRRVVAARPKGSTIVQYSSPDLDPTTIAQLGVPNSQCSGRFTGPFGAYINGPANIVRFYNEADANGNHPLNPPDGTTSIGVEGCFSSIFGYEYEFRGQQGPASMIYEHLRMSLRLEVNGFAAEGVLLQHDPVVFNDIDSFDGVVDFAGPSGRSGLTAALGTFIAFDVPVTPSTIDLWRDQFDVAALMRMSGSTETSTSPNAGSLDGHWRGGVSFTAQ